MAQYLDKTGLALLWSKIKENSQSASGTIPTKVSELTNDKEYQTYNEVSAAISKAIDDLVGSASEDLNTLEELATALSKKVDIKEGMSLVSDELITKLNKLSDQTSACSCEALTEEEVESACSNN